MRFLTLESLLSFLAVFDTFSFSSKKAAQPIINMINHRSGVNSTWLITSELADQRVRKVLFTVLAGLFALRRKFEFN